MEVNMKKHSICFITLIMLLSVRSYATDYLTDTISWKNCCQAYNQGYPNEDFQTNFVGDFNGDGLTDKLYMCSGKYWVAYTENKLPYGTQGFSGESSTKDIVFDGSSEFERRAIGDFNGDGADDILIIRAYSNTIKLEVSLSVQKRLANTNGPYGSYINVSDGSYFFKPNELWLIISGSLVSSFKSAFENSFVKDAKLNQVRIGDVTGDGLDDIVILSDNKYVYIVRSVYIPKSSTSGNDFADFKFLYNDSGKNLGNYVDEFFLGDFNGDGYDDITFTKTNEPNKFYIALNNGKGTSYNQDNTAGYFDPNEYTGKFGSSYIASGTHGSISISNFPLHFIADFNGDGLDDKLYLCSSKYYISLSKVIGSTPKFQNEISWGDIDWSNYGRSYVGDFNGDGFADILKAGTNSTWDVRLADKDAIFNNTTFAQDGHNGDARMEKIVACWMFPFTYLWPEEGWSAFDNPAPRYMTGFPYITPIINWGSTDVPLIETNSSTWIEGPYSYLNSSHNPGTYSTQDIIKMQIESMIKAGIDVIVVDATNGFTDLDQDKNHAKGSTGALVNHDNVKAALSNIFDVVQTNNLPIKIAIGLGMEFWGRGELDGMVNAYDPFAPCYGNSNLVIGWEAQRKRQRWALDEISSDYISPYNDKYFYYQGKPLIAAYVIPSRDFPMTADGYLQETIPRTYFPDFNVKIALSANSTYAWFRGNNGIFQNGLDNTNYWSWGAELLNNNINGVDSKTANFPSYSGAKLPYNAECMSVMPGRTMVWQNLTDRDGNGVPRWADDNSNHYFESWKSAINADPRMVLICDWNTWGEATSIEACTTYIGKSWYSLPYEVAQNNQLPRYAWHDKNGNTDPFYYQNLTIDYSEYFKGNTTTLPVLNKAGYEEDMHIENNITFELKQNYPNPFNPNTKIKFSLPEDSNINLKIYNTLGQVVYSFHENSMSKGYHEINFDGSKLASGLYIYKLNAGKFEKTMKMLLVK